MSDPTTSSIVAKKPNIMRRLYDWTISWADKPYGMWALALISFAESSFFPIPPDVLLIPMVMGKPKAWFKIATVCTLSSVLGGLFGWTLGYFAWELLSNFFFTYIPGFSEDLFNQIQQKYQEQGGLIIFGAAFTPIPYKVFTIAAGVCSIYIPTLILASILGRGGRFYLVAIIIYYVGPKAQPYIDKYFNWLALAFFVLLVGGFIIIKHLH